MAPTTQLVYHRGGDLRVQVDRQRAGARSVRRPRGPPPEGRAPADAVCMQPKARFVTSTVSGSPTAWKDVAECLDQRAFLTERSHSIRPRGLDGSPYILEATVGGRYSAPHQGSFSTTLARWDASMLCRAFAKPPRRRQSRAGSISSVMIEGESSVLCLDLRHSVRERDGNSNAPGAINAPVLPSR